MGCVFVVVLTHCSIDPLMMCRPRCVDAHSVEACNASARSHKSTTSSTHLKGMYSQQVHDAREDGRQIGRENERKSQYGARYRNPNLRSAVTKDQQVQENEDDVDDDAHHVANLREWRDLADYTTAHRGVVGMRLQHVNAVLQTRQRCMYLRNHRLAALERRCECHTLLDQRHHSLAHDGQGQLVLVALCPQHGKGLGGVLGAQEDMQVTQCQVVAVQWAVDRGR